MHFVPISIWSKRVKHKSREGAIQLLRNMFCLEIWNTPPPSSHNAGNIRPYTFVLLK